MTIPEKISTQESLPIEALDAMRVGICRISQDGEVVFWNDRLREGGLRDDETIGRNLRQVLAPLAPSRASLDQFLAASVRALKGEVVTFGKEQAITFPDPMRTRYTLTFSPLSPTGDTVEPQALMLMIPRDSVRGVREHYEHILDSTPDGIMVMDPNRRIRVMNRACGQLLGRDPQEAVANNCMCGNVTNCHKEDGTSLADKTLCPARDLFEGGQDFQTEQMLTTNSDGEERWVETTYSGMRDDRGNVQFVIGVIRDIHERKMLESRLHQSEKLAALGELTAGIAHEIKNPLGILLSSVEIILDESRPREMQQEAATFIREEVRRLDNRLKTFLSFARPTPGRPEPIVLNSVIRRTLGAFKAAWRDIEVDHDLQKSEAIVHLDPDQLSQVLMNLCINAAHAMDSKGKILIRTKTCVGKERIEVHDTGPGIKEAHINRIFDPFFTTKAEGTGLGLSIVYQIITGVGASIRYKKSTELNGACFIIELPTQRLES